MSFDELVANSVSEFGTAFLAALSVVPNERDNPNKHEGAE